VEKTKIIILILIFQSVFVFGDVPLPKPENLPHLSLDREGAPELTLEKSVEHALREATTILKAKNAAEQTGMQLLQGYAQFLPNLTGTAGYSYNNGNSYLTQASPTYVTSENNGATYTVTSTLNIFNGLADISNLKSAVRKDEAANLSLKRAKQKISLDITQSYLQVVLDRQIVKIGTENLNRDQARERLFSEQARIGSRNLADLYRQQAQTSSDESFLLSSENKLRADQVLLLQKLRYDVAKDYKFIDPPFRDVEVGETRFKDEERLIQSALGNRVDLHAAALAADASHYDVSVVKAAYLPQLNFGAMLTSSSRTLTNQIVNGVNVEPPSQMDTLSQLQNQSNYTFGLTLTWTFFDRLVTPMNVENANVVASNLEIDAQDRKLAVEGEVRRAYGDYQTAIEQLHSSKRGLASAEKAFELVLGRYNVGSANYVDLTTAQSTLVQAQSARADALIGLILQTKSIEFALGETPIN
jgi:outer membrane protein